MRLIFMHVQDGPANKKQPFDDSVEAKNSFAKRFHTEGYHFLLKTMLEEKIFDEILVFIESVRGGGFLNIEGIPCYVVPNIHNINDYLKKGDVIWVRGGWRSWHNWLITKKDHWLLLYAANSGRKRWKFWNIVFDDLSGKHHWDARGRFFFDFKKPMNPNIFKPLNIKKEFDVCIGASRVSERKAQWKTVEVVVAYKKLFGRSLRCVLLGNGTRGEKTNNIPNRIKESSLDVLRPGMVSRSEVCEYMNKSHVFVYLGQGGQNDRGPLESLQCGTPVMIAGTRRHSPVVYNDSRYCTVVKDPNDFKGIAYELRNQLDRYRHDQNIQQHCHDYFYRVSGIEVVMSDMRRLFNIIKSNPVPNIEVLKKEYGYKKARRYIQTSLPQDA